MSCLLHQSPKFYNNDFLIVGLTTLGTLENFDLLLNYVEFANFSTTKYNIQKG